HVVDRAGAALRPNLRRRSGPRSRSRAPIVGEVGLQLEMPRLAVWARNGFAGLRIGTRDRNGPGRRDGRQGMVGRFADLTGFGLGTSDVGALLATVEVGLSTSPKT